MSLYENQVIYRLDLMYPQLIILNMGCTNSDSNSKNGCVVYT